MHILEQLSHYFQTADSAGGLLFLGFWALVLFTLTVTRAANHS